MKKLIILLNFVETVQILTLLRKDFIQMMTVDTQGSLFIDHLLQFIYFPVHYYPEQTQEACWALSIFRQSNQGPEKPLEFSKLSFLITCSCGVFNSCLLMLSLGIITTLMLLPTQPNNLGARAKAGKPEACNFIPSVQSCGTLGKTFTFVKPFSFVEGQYRGLECLGSLCNSTHSLSSMVDLPGN